jgi:hypothetical protein
MIVLVERIMRAEGGPEGLDADIALFRNNCKHPAGTDLIFWPDGCPHDPGKPEPTAEEIVDRALNGESG